MPVDKSDLLRMLEDAPNAAFGQSGGWFIDGAPYSEESALKVAELCRLTDLPLTAVVSSDLVLGLVRRVTDLERRLEEIEAQPKPMPDHFVRMRPPRSTL